MSSRRAVMQAFHRDQRARQAAIVQKTSAVGPLISFQTVGQPQWMRREFTQFATEGYKKNVLVHRCITELVRAMANIPRRLYRKVKEIEEHPVLDLLDRPNPWQGGPEMFQAHYAYWFLAGNNYLEGNSGLSEKSPPLELFTHRPDRMRIIPSAYGTPAAYVYQMNGSQDKTFKMNPVNGSGPILHCKAFDPIEDWYGQSFLEAAAYSIDQHNEASAWNKSLLQNSGRPSGALTYAPMGVAGATLTDAQFKQLDKQLDEKLTGSRNARRPLILDGGLDWKEMGLTPVEMDWLNGKDSTARDICMAFGVPPAILGIPGTQTFANYEEARLSFYEETVIPLLKTHTQSLNNWLVPSFDESRELRLELDLDEVPALAMRRAKVWEQMTNADYLTKNEKREKLGYDKVDGGDQLYVEASLIPLAMEEDEEAGADGAPAPKLDADGNPVPPAEGAAAPGMAAGEVQQQALNGIQITAMIGVLVQVSNEEVDPASAIIALQIAFPAVKPERIAEMVASADKFVPVKPDPPVIAGQPFGGAPPGKKPPKLDEDQKKLKSALQEDGFTEKDARSLIELVYGGEP